MIKLHCSQAPTCCRWHIDLAEETCGDKWLAVCCIQQHLRLSGLALTQQGDCQACCMGVPGQCVHSCGACMQAGRQASHAVNTTTLEGSSGKTWHNCRS